MGLFLVQKPKF